MHRAFSFALLALAAAVLVPTAGFAGSCTPAATRLCLHDSRFGVEVAWTIPGDGEPGVGHASPLSNDTGLFWFFRDSNLELVVKVLDGRTINGHFWVYYGGLSDVEYTITVTDHKTGASEIYHNPASQLASGADTSAFAEEPAAAVREIRFGMLGDASETAQVPTAPAVPVRQGSELPVNVTTQGMQWHPAVAFGPDGGFMVVWSGDSPPYDSDVYGRVYDAQGNPRGGEIRINDYRQGDQTHPRVAAAFGGGYLVVWEDGGIIVGRLYGADSGQPLGDAFRIGLSPGTQSSPDVVATGGGFVVSWVEAGLSSLTGDPFVAVFGQRLTLQGVRSSAAFTIGDGADSTSEPRLAATPGGGFVATWSEHLFTGDPGETNVFAQRFDSTTIPPGNPIQVNLVDTARVPGLHQGALPLVHADGSFSVLWTTSLLPHRAGTEGMFARRYDAAGAPATGVIELRRGRFPQGPAAAALPSGDALVLWYEEGKPADSDGGVLARLFDGAWAPRGSEFRINAFTELTQTEPALALDASGHLAAVWSSGLDISKGIPPFPGFGDNAQDGSGYGVFAQRFTTATCAATPDELCLNGRFRVAVQVKSPWSGEPQAGHALPLTSDTGAFWFFGEENLELLIKVLDGRAVNGRFWIYAGALSDVDYTITVTDTATGKVRTYHNAQGHQASRADVEAF